MLLSKIVKIKWHSNSRKYYEEKGYAFTYWKDEFEVKVSDLSSYCTTLVDVKCDYCGKIYQIKWNIYNNSRSNSIINKDACSMECGTIKRKEATLLKYGYEVANKNKKIGMRISKTTKTSYDIVKREVNERGYTLITTEDEYYNKIDKRNKIKYICNKHKEDGIKEISWDNFFNAKQGCRKCSTERNSEKQKMDYKFVKNSFENRGYELLSNKYIDNQSYLYYKCPSHGIKKINWGHFQSGEGCAECSYDSRKGENNNKWNGGVTEINHHLRGLLTKWKTKILEEYNYQCCLTGINDYLEIHHIYSFYAITQDTFNNLGLDIRDKVCDYSKEEMQVIEEEFLRIHMDNLGCPLIPELHKLYHSLYGVKDDTPENFKEFIDCFDNHEFDDIIGILK